MGSILNIKKDIKINDDVLGLFIDVDKISAEGRVERIINDTPAKSLVANFGRMMLAAMSNGLVEDGLHFNSSDNVIFPNVVADFGESMNSVASVTVGNPTRVTFSGNISRFASGGDQGIQLMGIGGITPDINGFHPAADITYVSDSIVDIAIDTTGSPAFISEGARARLWEDVSGLPTEVTSTTFGRFILKVGRDATANVTDQQSLNNEFDAAESTTTIEPFELVHTNTVLSAPTFNFTTDFAELFFSGIVTNNTGETQIIKELGLYSTVQANTNDNRYVLIARDLVSPVTLDQGESAVISYKLRTTLTATGGFLEQFMRILYRQFALGLGVGNIDLVDINGATDSGTNDAGFIHTMGMAGGGYMNGYSLGFPSDEIGIQVGTGNATVILEDRALETRVDHGEGSGELIQYGQIIENFQIAGTVASFDLIKYYENVSGGSIDIDEIGIYCGTDESNSQVYSVACIYREVLASTQTVADGDILKVVMSFQVTVSDIVPNTCVNLDEDAGPFNISVGDSLDFRVNNELSGYSVEYVNEFGFAYGPAVTDPTDGYKTTFDFLSADTYQIKAISTLISDSSTTETSLVTINVT